MQNAHESMQDGCDSRNTRKHGIPFDLLQFGEVFDRRVQSNSLGNCKISEIRL